MSIAQPENGRRVLLSFFKGIADNLASIPAEKLGFGDAPVFTDLQAKQLLIPREGKHYYCLNFALTTEKKETRDEVLFLLQMIVNQALGPGGKGYKNIEKKIRVSTY